MADVKESAMAQKNDCKWVRALDSNGNSILISKEDLASVVGELLKINTYFKAFSRIKPSEIDSIRNNGVYWVDESEDIPSIKNTCLLVFNSSFNNTIQFIASYTGATLKYRIKWVSNNWTPWKELL